MAQLIVSMNVSLDGYMAAQGDDDGSWLHIDEEVHLSQGSRGAHRVTNPRDFECT